MTGWGLVEGRAVRCDVLVFAWARTRTYTLPRSVCTLSLLHSTAPSSMLMPNDMQVSCIRSVWGAGMVTAGL
jgi:hypothetical protein